MIKLRTTFMVIFTLLVFAASCYLLAFGSAILCCSPRYPGQGIWQYQRFFYGLLPLFCGAIAFRGAWRHLARALVSRRALWVVGCMLTLVAGVIDLALFVKLRGDPDDGIKLAWSPGTSTFNWSRGEVRVPPGFIYTADHGIDTFVGHFTSPDGAVLIGYDIGELAAEHGGVGSKETLRDGSRVRIGRLTHFDANGTRFFAKVSFPDNGCANFFLDSASAMDASAIDFIARSFRPIGSAPAWLRPLLPEVMRSDCRQRFKVHLEF